MNPIIQNVNLKEFNQTKAKTNVYYIDEENKLIAILRKKDGYCKEFTEYYTNTLGADVNSVYDLFDINDSFVFIIYEYELKGN